MPLLMPSWLLPLLLAFVCTISTLLVFLVWTLMKGQDDLAKIVEEVRAHANARLFDIDVLLAASGHAPPSSRHELRHAPPGRDRPSTSPS